jgi:sugar lactone lactonase YvrE
MRAPRGVLVGCLLAACSASAPAPAPAPLAQPDATTVGPAPPWPDAAVVVSAPADAPSYPDAATPPADVAQVPEAGPPPPLGPFPLAAVQAARPELVAAVPAHNEGPAWRDGEVFFAADGMGLLRADAQGKVYRYHPSLNPVGARTLADGTILLCEKKYILLQMFRDGRLGVLVGEGTEAVFCNDVTVDAAGDVFFTDSRTRGIMRLTPEGQMTRAASSPGAQANGIEVDPGNHFVYFSDTGANALFRAPLTTGGLGAVERLAPAICDGMAFDAWGNLWMAQITLGQAFIYDPGTRQVIGKVNMGGPEATNLVFGGPANDQLYTTVVNKGLMRVPVGARGFSHPGAAKYAVKMMLDLTPANTPL